MLNSFFIVVNPSSGNTNFKKSWETITHFLKLKNINFSYSFTEYRKHEVILVDKAIKQGYRNIISVGGDGTLHHVVNGIMKQRYIKPSKIKLGVIPLGTGNDWIKTYNIPNSIEKSINVIVKNISNSSSFIEADGEIIGINSFYISIMPKSIKFLIP